jgi:hypothetical protein
MSKTIVGIDPDMKTGIAIMRLDGSFLFTGSRRNFPKSDISDVIGGHGSPVIIATDVVRPPLAVKKIAASFDAVIFSPHRRIGKMEKEGIASRMRLIYRDHHERDAIIAAVLARRRYRKLFDRVDLSLRKKGLMELSDHVKELLLKRRASNVETAVALLKR